MRQKSNLTFWSVDVEIQIFSHESWGYIVMILTTSLSRRNPVMKYLHCYFLIPHKSSIISLSKNYKNLLAMLFCSAKNIFCNIQVHLAYIKAHCTYRNTHHLHMWPVTKLVNYFGVAKSATQKQILCSNFYVFCAAILPDNKKHQFLTISVQLLKFLLCEYFWCMNWIVSHFVVCPFFLRLFYSNY